MKDFLGNMLNLYLCRVTWVTIFLSQSFKKLGEVGQILP